MKLLSKYSETKSIYRCQHTGMALLYDNTTNSLILASHPECKSLGDHGDLDGVLRIGTKTYDGRLENIGLIGTILIGMCTCPVCQGKREKQYAADIQKVGGAT